MIKPRKALDKLPQNDFENLNQQWRLKLDKNENVYGCANNILSAIKNISNEEISQYPIQNKLIDKFSTKTEY